MPALESIEAMSIELSQEERDFIKNLLNQLSIKPMDKDAGKIVQLVQSLLEKL